MEVTADALDAGLFQYSDGRDRSAPAASSTRPNQRLPSGTSCRSSTPEDLAHGDDRASERPDAHALSDVAEVVMRTTSR